MKEKGANRIYIQTHVDHQGYDFYGVNLTSNLEVNKK